MQRDGNSGISFELSISPVGAVKLWFDGKPMVVSYMAISGDYPIQLEIEGVRVPAATFTVTPR